MTSKPKLNQPDVESTITSPIGESLNINFTIPSKQFEQVFEKDTNIEKRNLTLEEVQKEWEELGYEWSEYSSVIHLCREKLAKTETIIINKKDYYYYKLLNDSLASIDLREVQLLIKTIKALRRM